MVRAHRHHYQLELDLSNYGDLLAVRYHCHDNISRQKEALNCIRAIKNVSRSCVQFSSVCFAEPAFHFQGSETRLSSFLVCWSFQDRETFGEKAFDNYSLFVSSAFCCQTSWKSIAFPSVKLVCRKLLVSELCHY